MHQMGSLMQREGTFIEPSALELCIAEACQAVGNLCVLQDYLTSSGACTTYRQLQTRSGGSTTTTSLDGGANQQWRARMPGLFYANYGVVPITASAPELPKAPLRFCAAASKPSTNCNAKSP